eukprot:1727996-Rhodomonas_salina.2
MTSLAVPNPYICHTCFCYSISAQNRDGRDQMRFSTAAVRFVPLCTGPAAARGLISPRKWGFQGAQKGLSGLKLTNQDSHSST